jgi:V/A-type H+-transporting ATPase subunit I
MFDILPHLAPFFMLFFGLCLGDAGYGHAGCDHQPLVIRKPKLNHWANWDFFLGGCAISVACDWSFAGIDLSQQDWAFLAPVKGYFINDNHKIFGYSPMMVISVIIGLVQVLLGITLAACKAAKNHGWRYGIGKLSWVIALVTLTLTFGLPLCGVPLPKPLEYLAMGILAVSVIGIFFYNSPGKNIFVNFGGGLWNTYGMASGLLGDLLSYVRLYALGLTGGVLGGVFNSLAVLSSSSLPWYIAWLPFIVVLLFGHTLNFALCMISSFVHPMRLTFVEFFKNAEFEGGGKEYNPFHLETYKES